MTSAALNNYSEPYGPFSCSALDLHSFGLAPIPVGGEDGKVPLIIWGKWKVPPPDGSVANMAAKYPSANIGVLTGLSRVTVVDIDDPDLLEEMLLRCGYTPLITGTPRGGFHLWYASSGEASLQGLDGLKVDIKGLGGMVVVPPSIRPSGRPAGKPYTFIRGSWADLVNLPKIRTGALAQGPARRKIPEGIRDDTLFKSCLDEAPFCDTLEDLLDVARTLNLSNVLPLPDRQVVAKGRSAWGYEQEGKNFRGHHSHDATVPIPGWMLDFILTFDPKHGPDALALFCKLRAMHGARDKRGQPFAIAAKAMAADRVLPWSDKRIYRATKVLSELRMLRRVKTGGRGKGDPHLYRFGSLQRPLVPRMGTNVIEHPSPPLESGQLFSFAGDFDARSVGRVPASPHGSKELPDICA